MEHSIDRLVPSKTRQIISWVLVAVIVGVFLPSIPFKFSGAPETQHIFGTIGKWLAGFLGNGVGSAFSAVGGYVIGSLELLTSIVLLIPAVLWFRQRKSGASEADKDAAALKRARLQAAGGLAASALMGGAIFFHLFSKLGINVNNDNGALFSAAVTVFFAGIVLFLMNRKREACPHNSRFGRFTRSLKPRSWKHWLFWVELMPVVVIAALASFLGFFFHQANTDRYPDQEIASVPTFEEIILPFTHEYTIEKSLPFFASAVIDINNDGVDEIYLGGGLLQPDVMYAYQSDGSFKDISQETNIGAPKNPETFGVAVLDVDENGFDDLVIARENDVFISYNTNGVFTEERLNLPFDEISAPLSVALGDVNNDGHVDMYVAAYIKNRYVKGQTGFNDHTYGASSLIFLNNGDNSFTDITQTSGMTYIHNTFQGNFVDIDGDRDMDLVVSHDTGQVRTWRNDTAFNADGSAAGTVTFTNVENPNSNQFGYPMGNAIGDYNNDGLVDFAFSNVGNMGPLMNKIVRGDLSADQVYNPDIIVFKNEGDFKFTDTAAETNLRDYEFSWGMLFEDFNADTLQDLIISENYVQLPYNHLIYLPGRTLFQAENGKFADKEKESNTVNKAFEIAAIATDFNNDGALDMVRANLQGQSKVQMSNGHGNNWLKLKLPNTAKSLGAVATARLSSGKVLTKHFITSEGLCSDSSHLLYFGLGQTEQVSSIDIQYLTGPLQTISNPGMNKIIKVARPAADKDPVSNGEGELLAPAEQPQ